MLICLLFHLLFIIYAHLPIFHLLFICSFALYSICCLVFMLICLIFHLLFSINPHLPYTSMFFSIYPHLPNTPSLFFVYMLICLIYLCCLINNLCLFALYSHVVKYFCSFTNLLYTPFVRSKYSTVHL